MRRLTILLLLAGCEPSLSGLSAAECGPDAAPDPEVDAAIDAPPDPGGPPCIVTSEQLDPENGLGLVRYCASAVPVDLATAWAPEILVPSNATLHRGADGAVRDAQGCWHTPWEQGNTVTRACASGGGMVVEDVATGLGAVEAASPGQLDGDSAIDTAWAGSVGVGITFRGAPNVNMTLPAVVGGGQPQTVAVYDVDGDAHPDVVYGTRPIGAQLAGTVAICRNPGPATARTAAAWTCAAVSPGGWVMSIVPVVVGAEAWLVIADRRSYKVLLGTSCFMGGAHDGARNCWDLYGARAMDPNPDGTWTVRPISRPAGGCTPYTSLTCAKNPGDEMMLSVHGNTVVDCTSSLNQLDSRITIHETTDWLSWTHTTLPPVANVGHCQHVLGVDVNRDGRRHLVVSAWKGNDYPVPEPEASRSGVYWLRDNGDGTWSRGEISGSVGGKFDNVAEE